MASRILPDPYLYGCAWNGMPFMGAMIFLNYDLRLRRESPILGLLSVTRVSDQCEWLGEITLTPMMDLQEYVQALAVELALAEQSLMRLGLTARDSPGWADLAERWDVLLDADLASRVM